MSIGVVVDKTNATEFTDTGVSTPAEARNTSIDVRVRIKADIKHFDTAIYTGICSVDRLILNRALAVEGEAHSEEQKALKIWKQSANLLSNARANRQKVERTINRAKYERSNQG